MICGVKRLPRCTIFTCARDPRALLPSSDSSQTTTPLASICPLRVFTLELSNSMRVVILLCRGTSVAKNKKKNPAVTVKNLERIIRVLAFAHAFNCYRTEIDTELFGFTIERIASNAEQFGSAQFVAAGEAQRGENVLAFRFRQRAW